MSSSKIAVIFGGRSGEHDVSVRSAASIMKALIENGHDVFPVGITREGSWIAGGDPWKVLSEKHPTGDCDKVTVITDPTEPGFLIWRDNGKGSKEVVSFHKVDLVFPVLHGPYGEDGSVQGLLEMAGLPYIGPGVLASAAGMDKVIMKEIFMQKNLPVGNYLSFMNDEWAKSRNDLVERVSRNIEYPCFIKPANLGSSVGISKAYNAGELVTGVIEALLYDEKIVVEAFISGREIECSVLGDMQVSASLPGEIIPNTDFYDYHAKYIDDRSELIIPAKLSAELIKELQTLAIKSFKAISASGMARVDFFVDTDKNEIFINEINTIPGFTSISMYPKLWEASGISFLELVEKLVQIALDRHERRSKLKNSPPA